MLRTHLVSYHVYLLCSKNQIFFPFGSLHLNFLGWFMHTSPVPKHACYGTIFAQFVIILHIYSFGVYSFGVYSQNRSINGSKNGTSTGSMESTKNDHSKHMYISLTL